ncbi:hypothetical protein SAMN05216360_10255 [Methylobacterium phyllostachyos]|uniref:Uncharacterized protein n=1 Tax=Methylobacterium phyllostachyos TaxID=582672 RepID=A0A1G9T4D7_9HYPH|nr:hypothetical protein SAMN05216360_10255 [Methylobacterium phyllostachyos]
MSQERSAKAAFAFMTIQFVGANKLAEPALTSERCPPSAVCNKVET